MDEHYFETVNTTFTDLLFLLTRSSCRSNEGRSHQSCRRVFDKWPKTYPYEI